MIPNEYLWSNILLLGIGTFFIRFSIIAISARVKISERIKELFSFIPAAILPAFVAPMVFFHQGTVDWLLGKERLFILCLAAVLCYFTRSTLLTIAFGLAALFLMSNNMFASL
jgi:branched-subunit amino acid transport protein